MEKDATDSADWRAYTDPARLIAAWQPRSETWQAFVNPTLMQALKDESLRQQVLTNVHAPEMYRANGPVRNVTDFYNTFNLTEGDKLFLPPDQRVKIW